MTIKNDNPTTSNSFFSRFFNSAPFTKPETGDDMSALMTETRDTNSLQNQAIVDVITTLFSQLHNFINDSCGGDIKNQWHSTKNEILDLLRSNNKISQSWSCQQDNASDQEIYDVESLAHYIQKKELTEPKNHNKIISLCHKGIFGYEILEKPRLLRTTGLHEITDSKTGNAMSLAIQAYQKFSEISCYGLNEPEPLSLPLSSKNLRPRAIVTQPEVQSPCTTPTKKPKVPETSPVSAHMHPSMA